MRHLGDEGIDDEVIEVGYEAMRREKTETEEKTSSPPPPSSPSALPVVHNPHSSLFASTMDPPPPSTAASLTEGEDQGGVGLADDSLVDLSSAGALAGRWTKEEHDLFLKGLELYGREWKKIAAIIPTRTVVQIRTHAQVCTFRGHLLLLSFNDTEVGGGS